MAHRVRDTVDTIAANPDFRGPHIVTAARTGAEDEQVLKRIWHYTARFGG